MGGILGAGETGAIWANTYLPFSHSDSVFAALVEAAGFAGGVLVILGFCLMLVLFRKAALDTKEPAAKLFLFAAGCMIMIQTSIHIGVNATLIPPTGLPLPFFSSGGAINFSCLEDEALALAEADDFFHSNGVCIGTVCHNAGYFTAFCVHCKPKQRVSVNISIFISAAMTNFAGSLAGMKLDTSRCL